MNEKQLQQAVLDCATALGWRHFHTFDSRRSDPGFPDLVLARVPDRLLFVELKSETGRMSREQAEWISDLLIIALSIDAQFDDGYGPMHVQVWTPEQWDDGTIERALR